MARLPRLSIAGEVHHVLLRGHNRQAVFLDDEDRTQFLLALREASQAHGLALHAYVLMDNHVHLVATPADADGLGKAMQVLGRRYVAGFNRRHGRSGTLWEGRFRAAVVEASTHLLPVMQFVESNPVRAGWVASPQAWRWSSAAHHLGGPRDPVVTDHPVFWAHGNTPFDREAAYRRLLAEDTTLGDGRALLRATANAWVLGSPEFLARLSRQTDRPLVERRRGRPRKRVE